jgi:phenylpropionate dioxygenase-like ring-hydroxylating dioxygenase large terminal subunit
MSATRCTDALIRNQWHAIAALPEIPVGPTHPTLLLGEPITYRVDDAGRPCAHHTTEAGADLLPVRTDFGYLWTSLGDESAPMFEIPEAAEADRRTLNAVTVGIETSPPRAVENFLDLAHFPFVHPDTLGAEPHTEVRDYEVDVVDGDIVATECTFYQPRAAAASEGGVLADYRYRVPHPYAALLYKSSPADDTRWDTIGIFIHPLTDVSIRAHLFLSILDDVTTDQTIRAFQQTIIGQDKVILENHIPRRLPLDPRAETPIRADKTSIAYRRWLAESGVTYGVIPAAA